MRNVETMSSKCQLAVETWRDCQIMFNPNFTAYNTLDFVKQICDKCNLGIKEVKELFDEYEYPYIYNIEKGDIEEEYFCQDCGFECTDTEDRFCYENYGRCHKCELWMWNTKPRVHFYKNEMN